jgi:myxalamid-type polyketide synthase MxaD
LPAFKVLPISGHTPQVLRVLAEYYRNNASNVSVHDLCHTVALEHEYHPYRVAFLFQSTDELVEYIDMFLAGKEHPNIIVGSQISDIPSKIAFVFPGHGSEWLGMGLELMESESDFFAEILRCDLIVRQIMGWSLIEELSASPEMSRLEQVDVIEPAILAMQVALASLWRSWGVEPDGILGQSMGETAAAHVSGVLSLEDATKVICTQGQLLTRVSGQGTMLLVNLTIEETKALIADYPATVFIAISNSPTSIVLSGARACLEEIAAKLDYQEIFNHWVKADSAFHSPRMEPLLADFEKIINDIIPQPEKIPIYSSITTEPTSGLEFGATFWTRNLRSTVLFSETVQRLLLDGYNTFIEISPHPIISISIKESGHSNDREIMVLPSLRRHEPERFTLLRSLATLYTTGVKIDWLRLYPEGQRVLLPKYPRQHRLLDDDIFVVPVEKTSDEPIVEIWQSMASSERLLNIEIYLQKQVANILSIAVQDVGRDIPLSLLGFESTMALELQSQLERDLGTKLSATMTWNYSTISALTSYIAKKLGFAVPVDETLAVDNELHVDVAKDVEDDLLQILGALEMLSDEDLHDILTQT